MADLNQPVQPRPLVRQLVNTLKPDGSRVISRLFVAGQEDFGVKQSRTTMVIDRVLSLTEEEVRVALDDVYARFVGRHDEIKRDLELHAHRVANRVAVGALLSEERWSLIGAYFTHEFSIEGASLTNPSMVMHPDQENVPSGSVRFAMSVRGIGEGHRSSIGFRSGTVSADGELTVDAPGVHPVIGTHWEPLLEQANFRGLLFELDEVGENARYVLDQLGPTFTVKELNDVLFRIMDDHDTFRNADQTVHRFRLITERNYCITFPVTRELSERVLWPVSSAEWRGMEDARFVRFQHDDGSINYYATYTAFDGINISQQLLCTNDFAAFETHPISGAAAHGKGMAIFPRKIGGQYFAMSRSDHESNSVAVSDQLMHWNQSVPVMTPIRPWELVQLGNCGSPIETEAGWILLTHGVGPMRTYSISASLLDLNDPMRVLGNLDQPLISPHPEQRDGYVPNVVYSCGAMPFGNQLVMPFGISDQSIGFAIVDINELLTRLTSSGK